MALECIKWRRLFCTQSTSIASIAAAAATDCSASFPIRNSIQESEGNSQTTNTQNFDFDFDFDVELFVGFCFDSYQKSKLNEIKWVRHVRCLSFQILVT